MTHNEPETVLCQCWCGNGYVRVTWEMVRNGQTLSCRQVACRPPDQTVYEAQ